MGERMAGRKAVITGGASGIGLATAQLFVREGARVGLVDRDAAALQAAARAKPHPTSVVQADVAEAHTVDAAVHDLAESLGGIDCLVTSAAARAYGAVTETSDESWTDVWRTNTGGTVNACRAALPYLREQPEASIVTVSSVYAVVGRAGMGAYDATKAALLALTRTLAVEEAAHGVRVNAVCPGSTWTPWTAARAEELRNAGADATRMNAGMGLLDRWAQPDEIAYPILWLASAEASFVTGQVIVVDGGLAAV